MKKNIASIENVCKDLFLQKKIKENQEAVNANNKNEKKGA